MTELHVCIVWEKARYLNAEILQYCRQHFRIVRVCEVSWSREYFNHNLSRFYGENLPQGCHKEEHCGNGPFLLIIFADDRPEYGERSTTRGKQKVNVRIFDFKALFREKSGGGHKIHATNNPGESRHDLALLLGESADELLSTGGAWNGEIEKIEQDLAGHAGWDNITQLFHILNLTTHYIVLRNYEVLPDKYNFDQHGDIDLLCSNYREMCYIANSRPIFREPYRVHNRVRISGADILFDFRYLGDNYYDEKWEKSLLENRRLQSGAFFVPSDTDYFYSLAYHALIHKKALAQDYAERLAVMARRLNIKADINFCDRHKTSGLLDEYMFSKGYRYTRPYDSSVLHNELLSASDELYHDLSGIVKQPPEVRDTTPSELTWPGIYHVSEDCRNLLEWYQFEPEKTLLEIGAGYGALSGFFLEKLRRVVITEASGRGVEIIRKRYAASEKVEIRQGNFDELSFDEAFDYITLIGGTGYHGRHMGSKELYLEFLRKIRAQLSQEGVFILAYEQCAGQEIGRGHVAGRLGVPGFPSMQECLAFNKSEMLDLLKGAGFTSIDCYYPFPDYRMPGTIYSEAFPPPYTRTVEMGQGDNDREQASGILLLFARTTP